MNTGYIELAAAIIERAVEDCRQAGKAARAGKPVYKIDGEQSWTTPLDMLIRTMRWAKSDDFRALSPADQNLQEVMLRTLRRAYDGEI